MSETPKTPIKRTTGQTLKRLAPLGVLVVLLALFFGLGGHETLNIDAIARNYERLTGFVADNLLIASLTAIAVYTVATALSIPAAWLLTVTIGLLFGWMTGVVLAVIGATLGATLLFLIARYALADFFKARAGDTLNKMAAGFREDAVSYMLFLRLAAIFPFALVNVVPAVLGVPFFTYVWTTAIGIIPGAIAYSYAGAGLSSIVQQRAAACEVNQPPCGTPFTAGELITTDILIAFGLLAAVSLLPVVLKRLRGKKKENQTT